MQDYHLQLVPAMLRELRPDLRIGFFLHIPFPPPELFMQLPRRAELLRGMLGADLVGFQSRRRRTTSSGWRRRRSALRSPDRASTSTGGASGSARSRSRSTWRRWRSSPPAPTCWRGRSSCAADLGDPQTVILGVDRLDYTKGIEQRLKAYRELLDDGPLKVRDTVLVQVAVPSRERVEHYQMLRMRVEREVGRINGEFGRVGVPAVHYLNQSFDRTELAALYRAADVMAVTPLRDGMNLVAKEYVAARVDGGGALVLSEFAGAAAELPHAYLVNPHDLDELKDALVRAIDVDRADGRRRMRLMQRHLRSHDVSRWAKSFLTALDDREVPVEDRIKRAS